MAAKYSILSSMSCNCSCKYNPFISCSSKKTIPITNLNKPTKLSTNLSQDFNAIVKNDNQNPTILHPCSQDSETATAKLFAILEAVADRIEMHANMGEQRNNWNSLLLNSINMMTLAATTMAGVTAAGGAPPAVSTLKLSSALLFAAATGLLTVVNRLQPSQLVEEQRNATRLFKQLHEEIQTVLALSDYLTERDVDYMTERVLALDKAYPLPLIGVMLEKFPDKLEPTVWWPAKPNSKHNYYQETCDENGNGWTDDMGNEMSEIVRVLKRKDKQDYIRLGSMALKLNKILSIFGPVLTCTAAVGSAFSGSSSSLGVFSMAVAIGAGALSTVVNSIEHGGQVGMVFEMYRNCAGFCQLMEETIEFSVREGEVSSRENGELLEMKVALQLGRSLSELKALAMVSASGHKDGMTTDEFASKLF